jgi:hypothetical protein
MAVSIQGAVILEQNDTRVRYKQKCDKCGEVKPGATTTSVSKFSSYNSSFKCNKCKNMQKVVIKG